MVVVVVPTRLHYCMERALHMTTDVRSEITNPSSSSDTRAERRARRIAQLYASDPQFRAAVPIPDVIDAARRPGLRLPAIPQ
jgi:fatty acid CoA ligase FadD9